MNYKQWLLYRAHSVAIVDTEPRVLGYVAWQNREYLRAWHSRAQGNSLEHQPPRELNSIALGSRSLGRSLA